MKKKPISIHTQDTQAAIALIRKNVDKAARHESYMEILPSYLHSVEWEHTCPIVVSYARQMLKKLHREGYIP